MGEMSSNVGAYLFSWYTFGTTLDAEESFSLPLSFPFSLESFDELSLEEEDLPWCFLERLESFFFLLSFELDLAVSEASS